MAANAELQKLTRDLDQRDATIRKLRLQLTSLRLKDAQQGLRTAPAVAHFTPTKRPVPAESVEALTRARDTLVASRKRTAELVREKNLLVEKLNAHQKTAATLQEQAAALTEFTACKAGTVHRNPIQLRNEFAAWKIRSDDLAEQQKALSIRQTRQDKNIEELIESIDHVKDAEERLFFMRSEVDIKRREADAVDHELKSMVRIHKRKLALLEDIHAKDDSNEVLRLEQTKRVESKKMERHESEIQRSVPTREHQALTIHRLEERITFVAAALNEILAEQLAQLREAGHFEGGQQRGASAGADGGPDDTAPQDPSTSAAGVDDSAPPHDTVDSNDFVDAELVDQLRRSITVLRKAEIAKKAELEEVDACLEADEYRASVAEKVLHSTRHHIDAAALAHTQQMARLRRNIDERVVEAEGKVLDLELAVDARKATLGARRSNSKSTTPRTAPTASQEASAAATPNAAASAPAATADTNSGPTAT